VELSAPDGSDGVQSEPLFEHRREHVLAGMLLHVIEAAAPVDGALHRRAVERPGEVVRDALLCVHNVQHGDARWPRCRRAGPRKRDKKRCVEVDGAPSSERSTMRAVNWRR